MFTSLQSRLKQASRWLPVALLPFAAHAQSLNYSSRNATTNPGTYTDLAANGTAIATPNNDDADSAPQPIGFTFNFNGQPFTQFVLNTNGIMRLGSAGASSAAAYPDFAQAPETGPLSGSDPTDVNLIAPFNIDLGPGASGTEYRVFTTGAAGSRICTVQWKNVADKPQAQDAKTPAVITSQLANFSFQVKLYEGTNNIDFVYGPATAGTGASAIKYVVVGIKGSAPEESVVATKASINPWSATRFFRGPYVDPGTANAHNVRETVLPDPGRTYHFIPTPPNDLSVDAIYTLGKVSAFASPVSVQAYIANTGLVAATSRSVTLTVSGATTYTSTLTLPAIPVGNAILVTFPAFPVTASGGTNTITVTVPADDINTNNKASVQQVLTPNVLSYFDPNAPIAGGIGNNSVANATIYVKYHTNLASTTVTAVTPTFAGAATTSNNYLVLVVDATGAGGTPGKVLYTSPARVRPLTAGPDVVPVPAVAVTGDFFVAVRQLSTTNFGLAYQDESPLRENTFYYTTDGTKFDDLGAAGTPYRIVMDVTLRSPLATQNEVLAAAVSLYPNPARQSFKLAVPAGSLGAGTATLRNALGQAVLTQPLHLPAAGGTVDFDVSHLAAGIYTLQVQSGKDLVLKRVTIE